MKHEEIHRKISNSMSSSYMNNPKSYNYVDYGIYLLLIFGITYIFISNIAKNEPLQKLESPRKFLPSTMFNMSSYKDELEEALAKASTMNKTVIITVVNKAYVEGDKPMLDLFLDGFWMGEGIRDLVNHLLIVAMDQTSYERCIFLRLHCYKLQTEGVDFVGEKLYMSEDFIRMMWRRTLFLGDVLRRGYNFIFTDTDVLWLRNPFLFLSPNQTLDLQISTDKFRGSESKSNLMNTGFYMIRSNNKTVSLFDTWYARKDNSTGLKEQDVFVNLMREGVFTKLGVRIRFLDTNNFSGFCQDSRRVAVVATVHANCCRHIADKLADLTKVVHDWRRYKESTFREKNRFKWTNHTSCMHSWFH